MRRFLIAICFIVYSWTSIAQNYRTHKVETGETIESIAKKYLVTPYDIYALNPDAKSGLTPQMVIIIPQSKLADNPTEIEERELLGFKTHKVKRKETLFSISKKYAISIDDIKKHNKRLYSEPMKRGNKIQIPQYKIIMVSNNLENTIKKYEVQPREGKWRIAYKFGMTIEELEAINPNMNEILQVGEEINVPNIADNEVKTVDEEFGYYHVLPKEGFYRLNLKLGLSQEELEELNPNLKEQGLKAGMILKVPQSIDVQTQIVSIEQTSLLHKMKNMSPKRLAVMLPFRLHRVDLDSIREARNMVENDGYMSVALDFHSGVLMALDSLKQFGISTTLDVYDTQARVTQVSKILSDNDFTIYDAVIGPFTSEAFDRTAETLKNDNVPVISAVTKPMELYRNVYQTIPSDDYLRKLLINYVKKDPERKQVIIISDAKNKSVNDAIHSEFSGAKQLFSRKNKEGKEANYILRDDLELVLNEGKNIVFLETINEGFVSNVTSMLSALNGTTVYENDRSVEREIILMTTNKNRAFEGVNISNIDLSNLKFHYPSVNRDYDSEQQNSFVRKYQREYKTEPNRYAVRGFDLTMDILLRLASDDDFYDASDSEIETEYVENKFRYNKKLFGGYFNEAAYIVKFEDLKLVEVKE